MDALLVYQVDVVGFGFTMENVPLIVGSVCDLVFSLELDWKIAKKLHYF